MIRKPYILFAVTAALVLLIAEIALAQQDRRITRTKERRVALVVGNADYKSAPLTNPVNDARDIAAVLRDLGFSVIEKINADKREMVSAIDAFYRNLRGARVGLFYFAGHGMQIQGANYLVPVGTRISSESDVQFEAVNAGRVLGKMHDAGNKLNIVILDACRDNPFKRSFRTGRTGLAQMDAPKGTIIAYATAPGSVAADGTGRNGIYTEHLLRNIKRSDLSVQDVFRETGLGVMGATGERQVPWTSATPVPEYCLARGFIALSQPSERTAFAEERARLEAERRRLAEEKRRLDEDRKQAAERERLAKEKAKLEAERKRIAEERRKLQEDKKQQVASIPSRPSVSRPEVIVFQDYFSNNSHGWLQNDIAGNEKLSIKHGKFLVIGRSDQGHGPIISINDLNERDNFKIEARIEKISGVENNGYGIVWGARDYRNMYLFQVSGNGHYMYGVSIEGKWKSIVNWTRTSKINKHNSSNKLAVLKRNSKIIFFINKEKVHETEFSGFLGNKVGFRLNGIQTIEVDYLTVTKTY